LELPLADDTPLKTVSTREMESMRNRLADSQDRMAELQAQSRRSRTQGAQDAASNQQQIQRLRTTLAQLQARLNGINSDGSSKSLTMGVQDYSRPVQPTVLVRGELDKPAQKVDRGFLQVLHHPGTPSSLPDDGSGRLELAQWLTSEENPLTARVMVNRIWQKIFGQGIVTSLNNFGTTGHAPSHAELLDYLALRFMEEGWSVKTMIRELVMTRTYHMSSEFNKVAYTKDPGNTLLWRATPRRLDAEALRDAMLVASGKMDLVRPHGSIVAQSGDSGIGRRMSPETFNRPTTYRSVYLPFVRDSVPESLALFDPSDPNMVTGARESSNVPGQALYLMNNLFVLQQSDAMARRLVSEAETPKERLSLAFKICYGRLATKDELENSTSFLWSFVAAAQKKGESRERGGYLALSSFCQGLLASAEFRFLN
ncbi:MAG: DUF1553 domain-containing protein, partial [Akkermansiaceae bacterium]